MADGSYELANLPAGDYLVLFGDCGNHNVIAEYYDDQLDFHQADLVSVTAGQTTSGIDAQLAEGGRITGVVTDEGGTPLEDICVDAWQNGPPKAVGFDSTEADGSYEIDSLPTGEYVVRFEDCGNHNVIAEYYDDQLEEQAADLVSVTAGQTTSGIDAQLAEGGRITGLVTDEGGTPLEDVCVDGFDREDPSDEIAATDTGPDGSYEAAGLPTGEYVVRFEDCDLDEFASEYYDDKPDAASADLVSVTAGATTSSIDAELSETAKIAGTVTDSAGIPLEDVCVAVYTPHGEAVGFGDTRADGTYEAIGFGSGDYKVAFSDCSRQRNLAFEFYDDHETFAEADLVSATSGDTTTGIDAELGPGGRITGTVTDAEGNPQEGVCVDVEHDGEPREFRTTETAADGSYEVDGLGTGSYRVLFRECFFGDVIEYYNDKPDEASANLIFVRVGETTSGVDAVLGGSDTTPPVVSITNGPEDGSTVDSDSVTFAFKASEPVGGFECKLDSGAFQPCSSPKRYTGLAEGAHTVSIRATDLVGNRGQPASRTFTVDLPGPPPPDACDQARDQLKHARAKLKRAEAKLKRAKRSARKAKRRIKRAKSPARAKKTLEKAKRRLKRSKAKVKKAKRRVRAKRRGVGRACSP